ncbi:MAG: RHS repeat-associated core domain-containing protein, partial [candidate division WOR-3 bacterium]
MKYVYDYLGRVEQIVYPDGEEVGYYYDWGGQVNRVLGQRDGVTFEYVRNIGYDEQGRRSYIEYGNGVTTAYSYNEERGWLDSIHTMNSDGKVFQNISYTFNKVGNLKRLENRGTDKTVTQTYDYNDLYELTYAHGRYVDDSGDNGSLHVEHEYTQTFSYDPIGNMLSKTSSNSKTPGNVGSLLNYDYTYDYDPERAHRVQRIGDYEYTYDAGGNTIMIKHAVTGYVADEQHNAAAAGGSPTDDATHGSAPGQFTDIEPEGSTNTQCDVKRYEWDDENRLTDAYSGGKHTLFAYDAGGERTVKYSERGETVYVDKMYQLQVSNNPVTITKHIFVGATRIASKVSSEGGFAASETRSIYYYHGDHLGSSNFVTDCDGEEYEHVEYTPYGETWIDEGRDTLERINYLFTSKELDTETGLYYFGARYLDPQTSRWLSSDPLMDGQNWYGYANNNPIKYIDPNGLFTERNETSGTVTKDDTLSEITANHNKKYKTNFDYNDIAKLNGINDPDIIKPGQKIKFPESKKGNRIGDTYFLYNYKT